MLKQKMIVVASALALLAVSPAYAKKDGPIHGGGLSPEHISQQGRESTNSPLFGQEKGGQRAMERKSESGLTHGQTGQEDDHGKAKGHDKDKAGGKAKGHGK